MLNFKLNLILPATAEEVVQMKTVSMLEFRKQADSVLKQVRRGRAFILTYRGKPVARLEPIASEAVSRDDPIYRIDELASETAEPLSNAEIDRIIYES
ncbi:MAG: type II toxin-antitoxin system Phd/YefM family antitoxin [Planctomycetes bacterium]|nr:type II toxin-antitoxin system Phd/YefM family antitoxin [Planctomycetota bacterium]